MKKSLLLLASFIISTNVTAFEYDFKLESRGDLVSSSKETTSIAGAKTTEKFNNFSNGLVRISLFGALNDSLSYRFRYRFLASPSSPTTAREFTNTNNGIDHIFIDHIINTFRTRLGKQNWLEAFGRESFLSGTDVFVSTLASLNYKAGFGSDYRYGVSFIEKQPNHEFTLAISNPNNTFTDSSGSETKNNSLALGFFYSGKMINGLFQPVLAYSLAPQDGDTDSTTTKTKKGNHTLTAIGFRSEYQKFSFDTDYKIFTKDNRNSGTTTTFPKEETTSIYTTASYESGEFTPIVYYILDKFESENNLTKKKISTYALGAFWKPFPKTNFRYHLMHISATTEADGALSTVSKVEDKKYLAGIKIDI